MDNEANIILSDAISFCRRDGRDPRLINMLAQSTAVELTEDALTIVAPSRFAYSYLMKQRETIETYLEEIAFCPVALIVSVPEPEGHPADGTAAGQAADEATVSRETPETPRAEGVSMDPAARVEAAAGDALPASAVRAASPTGTAAGSRAGGGQPAAGETGGEIAAEHAAAPAADRGRAGSIPPFAAASGDTSGITVKNTLSPDDFRRMMQEMQGGRAHPTSGSPRSQAPEASTGAGGNDKDAGRREEDAYPAVPINSKFTFENFVYGEENKHAYRSALRFSALADEPGTCTSLFIYGNSGLGKTHLLLAIKNELAEKKPHIRVKYANSQAYIDDFINEVAIQKSEGRAILRDYHAADVLIIDDIQNIVGKSASIEYFFQLMDEFIRNNKKVVIASDRAPKKLGMDERLTSRFNAGMLCLVSEPGFEMKYAILKRYYENTVAAADAPVSLGDDPLLGSIRSGGGHLTDAQLRHMAEVSGTNIRELESFCERCAGDSFDREQEGGELTGEEIDRIADEYFDTAHKKIHVDTVQAVVEEYYHVSHEELIGPRRTANIAFARHVAIYLAIDMCEMTTPMVGAVFGGRDHSTVLNSIKVIEKKRKADRGIIDELNQLRNKIILKS